MTRMRYILDSLRFHVREWAWVALGAALATIVISGALLVGDALRASLGRAVISKLGFVHQAMIPPRPIPESLVNRLGALPGSDGDQAKVKGLLLAQGSVSLDTTDLKGGKTVRGVTIQGVDETFWKAFGGSAPDPQKAWMNPTLARALGVTGALDLLVSAGKSSDTPRESLLGRKDLSSGLASFSVSCGGVLNGPGPGEFSLKGGLSAEPVLFVPLEKMQKGLSLEGRVNALLSVNAPSGEATRSVLQLEDYGLTLWSPNERVEFLFSKLDRDKDGILIKREWQGRLGEAMVREIDPAMKLTRPGLLAWYKKHRNHLTLESKQFYVSPEIAESANTAAQVVKMQTNPILVHLANRIQLGDKELAYSVVAGVGGPIGSGPQVVTPPGDDQALLLDFPDSPLRGSLSRDLVLDYFPAEHTGEPKERKTTLKLAGLLNPAGSILDPDITPEFPGITDKLSLAEWNPPFPYDNKRIKPVDEKYWRDYRSVPKVLLNLATAQKLFGSRFGTVTSIMVSGPGIDADSQAETFRKELLKALDPGKSGLAWISVREQALKKSAGNMDFSGLFLGFSFFLLFSAVALLSLLVQLHLERRSGEWGLLAALGWAKNRSLLQMFGEATIPVSVGIALGTPLAVFYCRVLLGWLESHWPGGGLDGKLTVRWDLFSLLMGGVIAFVTALVTLWWRGRGILKSGPASLLAVGGGAEAVSRMKNGWLSASTMVVCLIGILVLAWLGFQVTGAEAKAGCFFGAGALALLGLSLLFRALLVAWDRTPVGGKYPLIMMALRGATRKPGRSLLTAGLLASSVFLLVAVDAFHRTADPGNEKDIQSWSGGYGLWVELDLPLLQNPMMEAGQQDLLDMVERTAKSDPAGARKKARELLAQSTLTAFRLSEGDDISCLNLFQSGKPRVLGVPPAQISRGGFRFAVVPPGNPSSPWKALSEGGSDIPVFGENNTLMWTLHKGLGDSIDWSNEAGKSQPLKVAGILTDSVFQSELLMDEGTLLKSQPSIEGYRVILVSAPEGKEEELANILNDGWASLGARVVRSRDRLEGFLAVENTYLATFQALGFLGLLLGMIGLAIAQGRSVLERSGEWALMRAIGFSKVRIGILVMMEIMALMVAGLVVGLLATVPAVGPRVLETGLSWTSLALLTGSVLTVGLVSTLVAAVLVARLGVLGELRRE